MLGTSANVCVLFLKCNVRCNVFIDCGVEELYWDLEDRADFDEDLWSNPWLCCECARCVGCGKKISAGDRCREASGKYINSQKSHVTFFVDPYHENCYSETFISCSGIIFLERFSK